MSAFHSLIRLISDGDRVDAGTINRVLRDLDSNSRYLKDLLEAALLGQAVFARCVTVESDALVGMPVYYDSADQRYERALAAMQVDEDTGALTTAASTQVWGVVYQKHNSTLADILLTGYATLDIAAAVGSDPEAGVYYLSGVTAGGLVLQKPPVTTAVLMSDGDGHVYVNPTMHEALEQHKHYKFSLQCIPAGDTAPPDPGDRHEITNADTSVEGWLPADHAIFDGKAPAGAVFGYNLSASALNSLWPPLPVTGAYLEWNKGEDAQVGAFGVPLGIGGLAIIDTCGIWWLSDCENNVPWPYLYDSEDDPAPASESNDNECPPVLTMEMTLYWTRPTFQSSNTVVTSLEAATGSHLTITCPSTGQEANTGPLLLDLDLNFVQEGDDEPGHLVFKELKTYPAIEFTVDAGDVTLTLDGDQTTEFDDGDSVSIKPTTPTPTCADCTKTYLVDGDPVYDEDDDTTTFDISAAIDDVTTAGEVFSITKRANKEFARGPVVGALKAGTANVTLSSADVEDGEYRGTVTISVDDNIDGRELPVTLTRLDGVTEEFYNDVVALGFADGETSSIRCQINIPAGSLPTGTEIKLRFRILNRGADDSVLPSLSLSYRRIPYSATPAALPTTDTALTIDTNDYTIDTDEYIDIDSSSFVIAAGDIVLYTLTRDEDSDGPDIQILRQTAIYTV